MIIQIRKAKTTEWKKIKELNIELFKNDYQFDNTLDIEWAKKNNNYFKKSIQSNDKITLVSILDGVIIGYLIGKIEEAEDYRKIKKKAELQNMFVLEKYRGHGIGGDLVKAFLKWAKLKKIKRIVVTTSAQNSRAISFYKKYGFDDYDLVLEAEV